MRSIIGEEIAAETRPTNINTAPAMPEFVSEKP